VRSVTRALHRFGSRRTEVPQPGRIFCSVLDQMVKTKTRIFRNPLIRKDLFNWHGACKEPPNPQQEPFQ